MAYGVVGVMGFEASPESLGVVIEEERGYSAQALKLVNFCWWVSFWGRKDSGESQQKMVVMM